MNRSAAPRSPLLEATAAVGAAGLLFLLACFQLRWGEALGEWAPPVLLVVGLGAAANHGSVAGALLAVYAGAWQAATTAGDPGLTIAATAITAAGLSRVVRSPARRWASAGPAGWAVAAALEFAGASGTGAAAVEWRTLGPAVALGLLCGGLSAALRPAIVEDSGNWR